MEFNWIEMWNAMSLLAKGVAVALIIMGLASLSVFIERTFVLYRHRKTSKEFIKKVKPILENPHFADALPITNQYPHSFASKVMNSGIKFYLADKNPQKASSKLERYYESLSQEMRRGLTILSTVGSTAPFVGLLGTVIGIVSAFRGIAQAGSGGLAAVSAGIAEALVETALGLFVAIPAVIMFYFLSSSIDKEETTVKTIGEELVEKMEEDLEISKSVH
jgi:biopolymer transport protein ExbB